MCENIEHLLSLYRKMLLIRRFEEAAAKAYASGLIGGFLHLYIGQEAIAVGAASVLKKEDMVFCTYRDHGMALALGMDPNRAMAELLGKDTGCSRGLGGSMHFFDREHNLFGGFAIVGSHIPLAVGAAFKIKYLGEDTAVLCFFGEGATNIGGFHEGLSLAGLWKLPIVFVCENNQYAMGTPMNRTSPVDDLTLKAKGYAMDSDRFQGHDVWEVSQRISQALMRARRGGGPTFVEIDTYRFRGHSMSDPGTYRARSEVDKYKEQDPCLVLKARIFHDAKDMIASIENEVHKTIEQALLLAKEAEPAKESVMLASVYSGRDACAHIDSSKPVRASVGSDT